MPRSRRDELDNVVVDKLDMLGPALLAGPANVIMQLALPAVGYGVYESRVESGNLFKHPVKRTRTTLTYLTVAAMGSPDLRKAYRHAVNKAHAYVRSDENSPVKYNAFDPKLQLWVAACLYKGWEDVERLFGDPANITEEAYQQGAVMGTTLQMPRELWPATRADFEEYWQTTIAELQIDDVIRDHLLAIATLKFSAPPVRIVLGWWSYMLTIGFLEEGFREKMGIRQTPLEKTVFDAHTFALRTALKVMPKPLREFPFNLFLADVKWRVKTGRSLV
ncbi:MAG: oxygenase MpaB family protein [Gordonia sp. (in: high G+C Gram-positive bacteria)]